MIVTCGIAKGKKEAKRRCCEAMVLKMSDLPPAPPLHMQPQFQMQMRGMMRFPGGRGGRFMRGGRGGFMPPNFRPRLPPPESEETVFKKYDKTPRGDHPSKNHPISKLCEYIRKNGWPVPQWDLINEKIIQQRKNKHGTANLMLYTYKVSCQESVSRFIKTDSLPGNNIPWQRSGRAEGVFWFRTNKERCKVRVRQCGLGKHPGRNRTIS